MSARKSLSAARSTQNSFSIEALFRCQHSPSATAAQPWSLSITGEYAQRYAQFDPLDS